MFTGAPLPGSLGSGTLIVKLPEGGNCTASIDQRPPSSGRTDVVADGSPAWVVRPGIGQVMV